MDFAIESGATYLFSTALLVLFSIATFVSFIVSLDEPSSLRR